jgi:hypothetical protein
MGRPCAFILLVFSACVSTTLGQNLLKNGSFEVFAGQEPASWATSNIPGMLTLAGPSKESHSGKGGIKLEVKVFYGTKLAGTASQDNIPTSARRVSLSGYYTLKSVGGDKAYVSVNLVNESGSTVCMGDLTLEPSSAFKQFVLPLEARENGSVAKAKVGIAIMAGAGDQLHEGTTAVFDDLILKPVSDEQKAGDDL